MVLNLPSGYGLPVMDRSPDPEVLSSTTSGDGNPLVLIHGVAGSKMVWDRLAPLLEPAFTVIRTDLLGYGHSPKPGGAYRPERHVAAIRHTLIDCQVSPPYTLVGLSMGTNLALAYAERWPDEVDGLIGIGFPYYRSEDDARVGLRNNPWTRMALEHPMLAPVVVPLLWRLGRWAPDRVAARSTIYTGAMAKDALRARYLAFRSSLVHCMVEYRLEGPLAASGDQRRLFVHGRSDQWATAEAVQRAVEPFENSAVRAIDGPHNLAVSEPDQVADLIFEHLGVARP
jgi:pimeloyl-ACP methyl ester carboxylesterase